MAKPQRGNGQDKKHSSKTILAIIRVLNHMGFEDYEWRQHPVLSLSEGPVRTEEHHCSGLK